MLILTAEFGHIAQATEAMFQRFIAELAVLTVLIFVLVLSLMFLRKRPVVAQRVGPRDFMSASAAAPSS